MFKIYFSIFILISMLTGCASVPSFKNESVSTPSKKGVAITSMMAQGITPLKILMLFQMQRLK